MRTAPVSRSVVLGVLVALACAAVALVLFATGSGAGVSPDSTAYVNGARALAAGEGFTAPSDSGAVAITHFPPLYPVALALLAQFGPDPLDVSRLLNAALFGAYVLLAGWLVWSSTGSALGGMAASASSLVSAPLLQAHAMVWSEPLFLFLGLGVIGLLARYRRSCAAGAHGTAGAAGSTRWAVSAAVLAALATLTRFAGFALVPAGALAMRSTRRWSDIALYIAVSLTPGGLWAWYNAGRGVVGDRSLGFHPLRATDLRSAWRSIAAWVAPASADAGAIALLSALALVVVGLAAARRQRQERERSELAAVAAMVAGTYLAFILTSRLLLDAHIPLDERILCPAYAWGLVALVAALSTVAAPGSIRFLRPAGFAVLALVTANQLALTAAWATHARQFGIGYNSASWRASPTLAAVRDLARETTLHSNGPDLVTLLTGRGAAMLPARANPNTNAANPDYDAEMLRLRRRLACDGAALVLLDGVTWRWYLPAEAELQQRLPLRLVRREADGAIYVSAATCAEEGTLPREASDSAGAPPP